jgi:hypothetical protein
MSPPESILDAQTAALLGKLAVERHGRVSALESAADAQAADIVRRARSEARERIRQAVDDARRDIEHGVAVRRAALETATRRAQQAALREILDRAWRLLPAALAERWQDPAARMEWCRAACAQAMRSLLETQALRVELEPATAATLGPCTERALRAQGATSVDVMPVPGSGAGLRIRGGDACLDATVAGLLAAQDRVAAELLAEFALVRAGTAARSQPIAVAAEAVT